MNKGMFGFPQNVGNAGYQSSSSPTSAPIPTGVLQSPARRLDAGPVGFPTPWRPTLLTGCLLWLDATDDNSFTLGSGSRVSQWKDKSGNDRHFAQATEAYQPLRDSWQNGLPTVRQAKDTGLTRAAISHTNCSLFLVSRISTWNATSGRDVFATGTSGGTGIILQVNNALRVGYVNQNIAFVQAAAYSTPSGFVLQELTRSGNAMTLYLNGSVAMTGSTTMNTPGGNAYVAGSPAGSAGNFNNFQDVAEVILYNSALATQDRIAVEQYLRRKWAIVG